MLKPLTRAELRDIDGQIADRDGWDFSRMHESFGERPFTFESVLDGLITGATRWLDQGTGGGERLLQHAAHVPTVVGIDAVPNMVHVAERNRRDQGAENVVFIAVDSAATGFPDGTFDLITNRHSVLAIDETARLLRIGGHFLTQKVGPDNAADLFAAFHWKGDFPAEWKKPLADARATFEACGLEVVNCAEYRIDWWIHDVESLIFWLRSVPTPAPFDIDEHWVGINRAIEALVDEQGIRTVEHRELLVARRA